MNISYITDVVVIMYIPVIILICTLTHYLIIQYYSLPLKVNQVNYIDLDVNAVGLAHASLIASLDLLNQQIANVKNLITQTTIDIDSLRSKIAIVIAGRTP